MYYILNKKKNDVLTNATSTDGPVTSAATQFHRQFKLKTDKQIRIKIKQDVIQ